MNSWTQKGRAHVLGDNIPHDGGMISFDKVIGRVIDPTELVPLLFKEIDPTLASRIKPGDFIVAGKNFLAGKAHNNALYALKALNVGILCESMSVRAYQGVYNLAVCCLKDCENISRLTDDGDELAVDYSSGRVHNLSKAQSYMFPPIPAGVQTIIQHGGTTGMLARHLQNHPELGELK
jgi:3-isopropylmalate/(R)-2-methylmalate dehydratase small subunit